MKKISTWVARHNSRQNSLSILISTLNGVPVPLTTAAEVAASKFQSFSKSKRVVNEIVPEITAGDEISGHVILKVIKAIPICQGVQLRFVGLEQTVVTEDDKFKYEETNVFEDITIPLRGGDSQIVNATHFEPGTYPLDFGFVVPSGIPGSFFYSKGSRLRGVVSYYFETHVNLGLEGPSSFRDEEKQHRAWLFSVQQPVNLWGTLWSSGSRSGHGLSPAMTSRPPMEFQSEKQIGTGLFGRKKSQSAFRVSGAVDRRMYFIGGPYADTDIVMSLKIDNPTSKPVTQTRVELIRVVSLWAEGHFESREIVVHRWRFEERFGNTNGAIISKRYRLESALVEDEPDAAETPLIVESILPMANGRARFRSPQQTQDPQYASNVVHLQQPEANIGRLIQCEYFIRVQLMLGKSKGPQMQIGDFVLTRSGPSSTSSPTQPQPQPQPQPQTTQNQPEVQPQQPQQIISSEVPVSPSPATRDERRDSGGSNSGSASGSESDEGSPRQAPDVAV